MSVDLIYLDRNENNYGPAPACYEVLKNADKSQISWYTKAYLRGVKTDLSERIAKDNNLEEDRVLLGYGAEDLLKQIVQCYLKKDEVLMIPAYSWWYYKAIAEEAGGTHIEYSMKIGEDSFIYDIDAMLELYEKEKPAILFISSPNNPTGNSISYEDLITVLEKMKDTVVVLDEAYVSEDKSRSLSDLINRFDKLFVIRTFSKYFALAGLRIGYAIMGKGLVAMEPFTKRYLGFNRLSEDVAIAAMDSPEYYEDVARKMAEDKEMIFNELNALEGYKVYKSDANFMLVDIDKELMAPLKEFLKGKGLIIKFMNEEVLNQQLRISLGTQEENRMLIDAIKEFMEQR